MRKREDKKPQESRSRVGWIVSSSTNMFLIRVEWRYNAVLISAVQWTYVYPLPLSPSHDSSISSLQVTAEYQTELSVL